MVDQEHVRRETEDLIARVLGLDPAEVRPTARIREDLGLDSYDLLELLEEMEDRFGIHLSDHILEDAATVADIVSTARGAVAAADEPRRHMAVTRHRDALARSAS